MLRLPCFALFVTVVGCSGPAGQSAACKASARCEASLDAKNGTNIAVSVHGPNGTCWSNPVLAAACDTDCANALAAAQKSSATNRLPGCEPGGIPYDGGAACAVNNGGCDAQADCTETNGAATCTCKPGFTGDGATCTANNPVPVLTVIAPSSADVASPATMVALTGTGFAPTAIAVFGGTPVTTTIHSSTSGTAVVPAARLTTVGVRQMVVVNPTPGGGTSNQVPFTVQSGVMNPLPVVTAMVAPTQVHNGSQALVVELSLTPATALATTTVLVNAIGVPTDNSRRATGVVRASIPAAMLASDGLLDLTVRNPMPGGGTVGVGTLDVVSTGNAVPGLTLLAPASAGTGAGTLSLTLTGTGFADAGTVRVRAFPDDLVLVPSLVTPTSVAVNLPGTLRADAGSFPVVYVNPAPGGGASAPQTFTVQ